METIWQELTVQNASDGHALAIKLLDIRHFKQHLAKVYIKAHKHVPQPHRAGKDSGECSDPSWMSVWRGVTTCAHCVNDRRKYGQVHVRVHPDFTTFPYVVNLTSKLVSLNRCRQERVYILSCSLVKEWQNNWLWEKFHRNGIKLPFYTAGKPYVPCVIHPSLH